ncbi:hypothetical protein OROHE_002748 [Orobanche hederae]
MDLRNSIRCQTDVALCIANHLLSQEKNIIFSPLSLYAALSIMAAGSEGRTLDQLLSFLQSDSIDHLNTFFSQLLSALLSSNVAAPSHHLYFVNGMWVDKSVSLSHFFKQLVASHYKATLASVDFKTKGDQVCREVNSWVERETDGIITKLLPPKFDASITANHNFHLLNGTSVKVPYMMSNKSKQFISSFADFKVLRLSFEQGTDKTHRFSMYIFLPGAKDGLPALIEKLASKSSFLEDKYPLRKVQIRNFRIPKFKISYTFEASNVLKELGVVSPFSKLDAEFTKITNSLMDELHVESMFHTTSIEVNEEGTEVTTASSVSWEVLGCDTCTDMDFVADHPFLFLIREDLTGAILFIGQVLHPLDGVTSSVKVSSSYMLMERLYDRAKADGLFGRMNAVE